MKPVFSSIFADVDGGDPTSTSAAFGNLEGKEVD